jgi:hypothetical protein
MTLQSTAMTAWKYSFYAVDFLSQQAPMAGEGSAIGCGVLEEGHFRIELEVSVMEAQVAQASVPNFRRMDIATTLIL